MSEAFNAVGEQLRGWDAATWRTASGDPTMRSTVIAAVVLEREPDWGRLQARMERLTLLVPALRMRPLYGVTGVSSPRLAVDPDFDLGFHLRHYRLPEGAGWRELLDEARRMSLTDFDPYRPLWEAALVEGLPGGRAVFLLKLHHSIADGQATVIMGLSLFEFAAEPNPDEPAAPEAPPAEDVSHRRVSLANLSDNLRLGFEAASASAKALLELAVGTVTDPVDTWSRALEVLGSVGRFASVPDGPMSPVMTGRGTTYHFAAFDLPFPDLRDVAKAADRSVNDAFMAAVGAGLDRYHRRLGVVADELRFNVPISLRGDAGDRSGKASNAVTIARFPLPVADRTVRQRMDEAHEAVANWRSEPALTYANPLAEVSWLVPVPVLAHAAQASDVTTSNVPGPPIPLYLAGVRVMATYPLVATIGAAVNVTMVTYDGTAYVGVSADDRAVPDLDALVADLRDGFAEVTGRPVGAADQLAPRPGAASAMPAGDTPHPARAKKAAPRKAAAQRKAAAPRKATATKASPRKRTAKKSPAGEATA